MDAEKLFEIDSECQGINKFENSKPEGFECE